MPVTFEVYGMLRPDIEIHWADFKVVNRATSQEMHVRDKFQLNQIQAYEGQSKSSWTLLITHLSFERF